MQSTRCFSSCIRAISPLPFYGKKCNLKPPFISVPCKGSMGKLILTTEIENADFYIASLAIGILEGMKSGALSLDVGIWSLARPIFWEKLKSGSVSTELIELISSLDEVDARLSLGLKSNEKIEEHLLLCKKIQRESLAKNPSLAITSSIEDFS